MSDLGRFIWYELLSIDPDAARRFYTGLLGLGETTWEDGDAPYRMLTVGDTPRYGILQLPGHAREAGAPSHWLGYVQVPDRAAAIARATELGGRHLVSRERAGVGRTAVLGDPQGAVIGLFEPARPPEAERPTAAGEVGWHELATTDRTAAFDFYHALFGWHPIRDMDLGAYGVYRIFGRDGRQLGGMWNRPAETPVCAWLFYIAVPSCQQAAERVSRLGGTVVNGPVEVPGGAVILQAIDPAGALFALYEPAARTDGA